MKDRKIIKILAVAMAAVMLLLGMTACNEEDVPSEDDDKTLTYTVSVIDTVGNPIKDVLVKFVADDGTSKTRVTDENGAASYKNAPKNNYTVKLSEGTSDAVIVNDEFSFADNATELQIVLRNSVTTSEIFGDAIPENGYASYVSAGTYTIPAGEKGMEYFLFKAAATGKYKISVVSSAPETTVGYYGNPMVVRADDIFDGKHDGKGYEINVHDSASPYVVGVNRADASEFTLKIERIGDAPFDPAYEPWTNIQATEDFEKCVIPEGTRLVDLDITDPELKVTLGDDGRYYTSDGKLVYIRITSYSKYWETELARLVGKMDTTTGINVGGYVYDDEGNFLAKYSYNEMIISYIEYCDTENGVYPLTEELAGAVKHHGEEEGWWTPGSYGYLFEDFHPIVVENGWLFVCCVAE